MLPGSDKLADGEGENLQGELIEGTRAEGGSGETDEKERVRGERADSIADLGGASLLT